MSAISLSHGTEISLRSFVRDVAKRKLSWLEEQRDMIKSHYAQILCQYDDHPETRGSLNFLKDIHLAISSAQGDAQVSLHEKDEDLIRSLSSIESRDEGAYFASEQMVEALVDEVVKRIKFQIKKCEHACLYATVMREFMKIEDNLGTGRPPPAKKDAVRNFSKLVLSDSPNFDKERFEEFLNTRLFNSEDPIQMKILNEARETIRNFCKDFDDQINNSNKKIMTVKILEITIDGLTNDQVMTSSNLRTLNELRKTPKALEEVSTLIDQRIRNFRKWEWPDSVFVYFQRNIAGCYRAHHFGDLVTALTLHYIGARWSVLLKSVIKTIYSSSMWKHGNNSDDYQTNSIEGYRREFHNATFLSILLDKIEDMTWKSSDYETHYDDDDDYESTCLEDLPPTILKKRLLYLISNEIHLNNVLRPNTPLTVVQTEIESFGPSVVHQAILSIMKFFEVPEQWLTFFATFLEAPLRIRYTNANVEIRKRGCPINHTLTAVFNEAILFAMDLYVNQVSGLNIYRIRDDFLFWSHDQAAVVRAWNAMQTFTELVDLKLDTEKSASVVCSSEAGADDIIPGPEPLPQQPVNWAFLILHSDGVYRINRCLLNHHVVDMRETLDKMESVVRWVYCHNKYIRFFIRNFLTPAKTLQNQHVEQILNTLEWILIKVHPETNGDPVKALKERYSEIWGNVDLLDSWVHCSIYDGGLDLYNPFPQLIALKEAYEDHETTMEKGRGRFQEMIEGDEVEWKKHLETPAEDGMEVETITTSPKEEIIQNFNEWCQRTREMRSEKWREAYVDLLSKVKPSTSTCKKGLWNWKKSLDDADKHQGKLDKEEKFVNQGLVPRSVIRSLRQKFVHYD